MTTSLRARPDTSEYAPFYHGYISGVPEGDVLTIIGDSGRELHAAVMAIPEERGGFRYAEGKWTIREVIGHLIDAERIFAYRALRIARADPTPLPSFEENDYVRNSNADERTLASLGQELATARESTVQLFESLPADAWVRRGTASGKEISVRAIAYIIAGHPLHHLRILRERYLIG
jgi:uncharacterized damage-inducible protein DinB